VILDSRRLKTGRYTRKNQSENCFFEWLRFWGREFNYDGSVACVRKGGITLRKGKNALKGPNPVASTSTQPEEQELLDDEWDEEADDEEVVQDESFNADWSRDFVCVADPFIVGKNCAGQIKKLVFTRFVHECRNTEGMLRLGMSFETILSREPPAGRPQKAKKEKWKQKKKDRVVRAQGKKVPAQEPKPRSRPGSPHSGVQRGSGSPHKNGRGGRRGGPSRIQTNNS